MNQEAENLERARQFMAAMEQRNVERKLSFFAADVVQQEFPNRVVAHGATRDLAALREGAERGQELLTAERYEILNAIASGDQVALEVQWSGTLTVPFGKVPAGGQLRARLAIFLEFRDGKIVRQRNYDCYEPW
jgi:ketosteroid isomerase-like protein